MINLTEIKVLIIEDEEEDAKNIKTALLQYKTNNDSKIHEENISIYYPKEKDIHELLEDTKKIIIDKQINVLFLDLNLGISTQEGIKLIRLYMNDPMIAYIPKYVITKETGFLEVETNGIFINADIQHYTAILNKPTPNSEQEFYDTFTQEQLFESLPIVIESYLNLLQKIDIQYTLNQLNYKIDEAQINDEESIRILETNKKILEKIDKVVLDIKEKTELIEIITNATAKALPKIATKAKAKKLIEAWEKDKQLKYIMGKNFPQLENGLFNKLKELYEGFEEGAGKDIGELLYEAGKGYINTEAGIECEDTKLVILMKYSAYFTEKATEIFLDGARLV